MPRSNPRLATFLILGLLAALGAVLILQATPEGLGLSDDSIAYIAGARSLLAGEGYREAWLESNGPVTHFPPMFSGTLAFLGLTGIDPLRGARLLNALLFGLNAALLGLLGWRTTKSSVAGILLALLFIVNESLFRVHAVAMSEPLFLFFSLLGFLCFDFSMAYISKGKGGSSWLIATGIITSLAYLTRYSGLALVATFIVAILFLQDSWRKRFSSAVFFLAGFIPLVWAWSAHNELVAGNATNRTLIWHPVAAEKLLQGLRTLAEFLVPVEEWRHALLKTPEVFVFAIVLIAVGLLVGLGRWVFPAGSDPLPAESGESTLPFTNALYIFAYLGAVLFSINFFDASTPLKARILAPIYVSLLFLLVRAGARMWGQGPRLRAIVSTVAIFIFSVSALGAARSVSELSRGGTGYASFQWYDSKIMELLRQLPEDVAIYTNEPGAVYLYTGRGCRTLPSRVDPVTGIQWQNYDEGVSTLRQHVLLGRAVLVVFHFDEPELVADYEAMADGLYIFQKSAGDALFTAAP